MASQLDKALDEIVSERPNNRGRRGRRGGGDRFDRNSAPRDGPRDGISKSSRGMRDPGRNTWQHDKYDDPEPNTYRRRERNDIVGSTRGSSKLKVDQIHYDLTEKDLMDVFSRVGNVLRLEIIYDRAGRSEGFAYVTYANEEEARIAIEQFDGANANGQPIRVKLVPSRAGGGGGGRDRNDGGRNEGGSLFDRINVRDDDRTDDVEGGRPGNGGGVRAGRRNPNELRENAQHLKIDRYVPGDRRSTSRDRRDTRPPRGGRGGERERRGGRRDERGGGGGRRGERNGGGAGDGRPRKTAEELDAEMNNYWSTQNPDDTAAATGNTNANVDVPVAAATETPALTVTEPAAGASTFGNGGWSAKDAADFEMMD